MNIDFKQLGFPILDFTEVNIKNPTTYHHKTNLDGEFIMWNTMSIKDIPKDGSKIMGFYVEDSRFTAVYKSAVSFSKRMKSFRYVIQPDFSVYYDEPLIDQMWRTWMGKKIARLWQDNNVNVIPNLVLGAKENFECAIFGIPEGQTIMCQIQANDNNPSQNIIDKWTIEQASKVLKSNILVYGTEDRFDKLALKGNVTLIKNNIYNLRNLKHL